MNIDDWFNYDVATLQNRFKLLNILNDHRLIHLCNDYIIIENISCFYEFFILRDKNIDIDKLQSFLHDNGMSINDIFCFKSFILDGHRIEHVFIFRHTHPPTDMKLPNLIPKFFNEYYT